MKKILISLISVFFLIANNANSADFGFNIGGSITAGVFSVDGASEKNADATINASSEKEDAEGLYALGSIFTELTVNDKFAIGVDYVPHAIESNQITNEKEVLAGSGKTVGTNVTNVAEVHFEEITTFYASYYVTENIYAKAGYIQADVLTKEVLGTGGAYPNTDIDGLVLGLGYEKDLASGLFVRLEASYTDLDGVTVKNKNDSTKSITVDGITGYGAKLSIGKSF